MNEYISIYNIVGIRFAIDKHVLKSGVYKIQKDTKTYDFFNDRK